MKTVHLAHRLTLPAAELATEVVASLGQRGSGKSNGAAVVAEGLLTAGVQVIVLDHVGIWFSLRLNADGKHSSPYQIPVLGGQHGDIALVATTGGVVAEALARSGSSAVLDVSAFSKGDRCRFAADFAEAFFAAKKLHPGPVQILLEEAQRYVPQKLFAGQGLERMLGAFEEIAEVGRNYGVGLHLISQRPQKINKDVLNLADTVLAYRANGVLERKAISEWVQEKGAEGRKEMHDELPGLPRGTAIVWSPNRAIYGRYAVNLKATYDAGATPTRARAAVKTKRLDLDKLEETMGAAVEEAKMNDPRLLKARIAELERAATLVPAPVAQKPGKTVEVSVFREADLKRIERLAEKLGKREDGLKEILVTAVDRIAQTQQAVVSEMNNLATLAGKSLSLKIDRPGVYKAGGVTVKANKDRVAITMRGTGGGGGSGKDPGIPVAIPRRQPYIPPRGAPGTPGSNDGTVGGERMPEKCQKMLGALVQGEAMGHKSMLFRNVAVIAGVGPTTGTTSNRKGFLKNNGYIIVEGDHVRLTDKGREYPLNVPIPPTAPAELLAFWKREIGTDKIARMLEVVVQQGPIDSETLREAVGMENSGTFSNYKGALVGRGLIEKRHDGTYAANEVFLR